MFEFLTWPLPDELAAGDRQPRFLPDGAFEVPGLYGLAAARQAPLLLEAGTARRTHPVKQT